MIGETFYDRCAAALDRELGALEREVDLATLSQLRESLEAVFSEALADIHTRAAAAGGRPVNPRKVRR